MRQNYLLRVENNARLEKLNINLNFAINKLHLFERISMRTIVKA